MSKHFRQIELPLGIEAFHRLPRNPAYKYEYFDGRAVLTPRPSSFTCVLDLPGPTLPAAPWPVDVMPISPGELEQLSELFFVAVRGTQPYASLNDEVSKAAADEDFTRAITGGDGPVMFQACFRAEGQVEEKPIGAAIVTLVPDAVRLDPFAMNWTTPPPSDAIEKRLGCPHLTWLFVHPWESRRGVATTLLKSVIESLMGMGFQYLASTFHTDNMPSILWHWRNGFRLLPQQSAMYEKLMKKKANEKPG